MKLVYNNRVQLKQVLVGIFSSYFLNKIVFLCCYYELPSARCEGYAWPTLTANSIWKSFLKCE